MSREVIIKDVLYICHIILVILRLLIRMLARVLLYDNHCRLWLTVKYHICGLVQDNNARRGGGARPRGPQGAGWPDIMSH